MKCSFLYTLWIHKQGKGGTWRLSSISSTLVMSTVGYPLEDIVGNYKCWKRTQSTTVYEGCSRCFIVCWKETHQNNPRNAKKENIVARRYKWKKTMVPKPAVDICYNGIHHWPEFGDKRNRCRMCSVINFVYFSKCQIHLCLQNERNCFMQFPDW